MWKLDAQKNCQSWYEISKLNKKVTKSQKSSSFHLKWGQQISWELNKVWRDRQGKSGNKDTGK